MTMEANPKLEDLQNFFSENFNFRYNVLTDMQSANRRTQPPIR